LVLQSALCALLENRLKSLATQCYYQCLHKEADDVPLWSVALGGPEDVAAVGQRRASFSRSNCKIADGACHLHRDVQPSELHGGGAVIGVVLLMSKVTEETGHTVFFPGSQHIPWSEKNRTPAYRYTQDTKTVRVLGTGNRGDFFVFDTSMLHMVQGATQTGLQRLVLLFDIVTGEVLDIRTAWGSRDATTHPQIVTCSNAHPSESFLQQSQLQTQGSSSSSSSSSKGSGSGHNRDLSSDISSTNSSVLALNMSSEFATQCLEYLLQNWKGQGMVIDGVKLKGYDQYEHTVEQHSTDIQRCNTLVVPLRQMHHLRDNLPGFSTMETLAAQFLQEQFSLSDLPKSHSAHILRQHCSTGGATAFSSHRDNMEFKMIRYSVIIKLTDDKMNPPSQMMMADDHGVKFNYGVASGSSAVFESNRYHSSVMLPIGAAEVIKLAIFFTLGTKPRAHSRHG
jgi:hypothetical protein